MSIEFRGPNNERGVAVTAQKDEESGEMVVYCTKCGRKLAAEEGQMFCKCGQELIVGMEEAA